MQLQIDVRERLQEAIFDRSAVSGATHKFYRYPARFSPKFAGTFIEALTEPGDLVVDPFVGGGTTLVEAMLQGRDAIGSDINELATFVSRVKTTLLSKIEIAELRDWFEIVPDNLSLAGGDGDHSEWADAGYFRNVNCQDTWRHQRILQNAIDRLSQLNSPHSINFARCVLLRTAQLALDGRKTIPSLAEFRSNLKKYSDEMLDDMIRFSDAVSRSGQEGRISVLQSGAAELAEKHAAMKAPAPKLILTSPPYPGVHVLYHRWQVKGRRETSAPYWIANALDGDGERYYTLGNRHQPGLSTYFENLEKCFTSISKIADASTTIVQMVAFSDPDWQLPLYLESMERSGLEETAIEGLVSKRHDKDGRPWRDVPNGKWYTNLQSKRSASKEVVLFHRVAKRPRVQ